MKLFKNVLFFAGCVFLFSEHIFSQDIVIVSPDGKGAFKTIQAAINSLPDNAKAQRVIFIKSGSYQEKLFIDKNFITLRGEDPKKTLVTISLARDEWRCNNKDDYGTAAINLKGRDITLENLSFINSYGKDVKTEKSIPCATESTGSKIIQPSTHQMALRSFATTRLKVINCIFRAWGGDTVSPWNTEDGMFYFKDCVMEGGVDFYCPRGWALAENCTFICQKSAAAIWHDGSKYQSSKTVLLNCKFKGDDNFKLGRFHKDAQFFLLNCSFASNMADVDIYLVPTNNKIVWGRRVYYYNCHKEGGDFAWHQNNLPADFGINEFNVPWVYDYKWNPIANDWVKELETKVEATQSTSSDLVADNMLLYQRSNGGWPKHFKEQNVNYRKILSKDELDFLRSGYEEGIDATIDNEATNKEIRYLLKAYKKSTDKRYLEAAEKGIQYLLKAQYKNGGWPQFFPDFSSYRSEITFNDNAMVNVLKLLDDLVNKRNDLDVVNTSYIVQSKDAIKRGIDCILKTQIKQNGNLSAWCAQYDAQTLQPAKARAYELPSISGSESIGIIQFLMTIDHPTLEISNAISESIAWLDKVKIKGFKFAWADAPNTPKGKDKFFLADSSSTIWARFYNLNTNEPFFCGRDGVPKKTIAEVEYERRTGYAWYGEWPSKLLLVDYPAWKAKWNK